MFHSFFPNPRLFLLTGAAWGLFCIILWYLGAGAFEDPIGISSVFGWDPGRVWLFQYAILTFGAFAAAWIYVSDHRWKLWSAGGSVGIVLFTWIQVQFDVMINEWFGGFYDLIQNALAEPDAVAAADYYWKLIEFMMLAMPIVVIWVGNVFFTSHFVFRWRTAMNDRYVGMWSDIRRIEGASQRIQEDTMKFAAIMETLGSRMLDSLITLVAFLPILWTLSSHITAIPGLGQVPQPLVFVAILWSIGGTALLALAGYRLPGLEFRNQRVEAAFRKELVLGEDDEARAAPPTLSDLFANVRRNYFTLYVNYLYFNIARQSYLQVGVILPYIILGPTIIAGAFTLGVMNQILRAFQRVENSFQFLVLSWTTIIELMSIYKRLAAFERAIAGERQSDIEFETEPLPIGAGGGAGGATAPADAAREPETR